MRSRPGDTATDGLLGAGLLSRRSGRFLHQPEPRADTQPTDTQPTEPPPTDSLPLTVVSQTQSTVTLGWTATGDRGYYFYVDGARVSNTADPTRSTVKFQKKPGAVFRVEAVNLGPFGEIASP